MNRFKKDPDYLLNYCKQLVSIFSILILITYSINGISFSYIYSHSDLLYSVVALLLCGLPSSILHNCAHRNWSPKFLNNFLGEVCGTIMLYGYKSFALGHMFHHVYPDSPDYDVHSPRGYTFIRFLLSPVEDTVRVVSKAYYERFGESDESKFKIMLQIRLFQLSVILKIIFIYLLLGPKLFIVFYIPMYISNLFVFAHINFITHIENELGTYEVINKNDNFYYKIMNFLTFGGYFHKNHHEKPQRLNPMFVEESNKKYMTYSLVVDSKDEEKIVSEPSSVLV